MGPAATLLQRHLPRAVHHLVAYRGLRVQADLPYADRPGCRLDVLRPAGVDGPLPVVVHIHGGAFRVMSKDTHGHVAARYAHGGALVVNVDYRLAPDHPFPAAVEDVHDALQWVLDHIADHGGDPSRLLLTGESAGANLVLGLVLSMTTPRPEPWARPLFARGVVPRAAHVICGFLQASRPERYDGLANALVRRRLRIIAGDYLGDATEHAYADPIVLLEGLEAPARPLPRLLVPCGTADPIAEDSRRLIAAAERLGVPVEAHWARGAPHGFHALPGRRAEAAWSLIGAHAAAALG